MHRGLLPNLPENLRPSPTGRASPIWHFFSPGRSWKPSFGRVKATDRVVVQFACCVRLFFSRESSYSGAHGDAASHPQGHRGGATGILQTAHLNEWQDIIDALRAFQFRRSELLKGGGGKSIIAQRIDSFLAARQWREKKFANKIRVDAEEGDSQTHKVDCLKGRIGLEIEWNNKDPFYDRDLNNFRLLFDL